MKFSYVVKEGDRPPWVETYSNHTVRTHKQAVAFVQRMVAEFNADRNAARELVNVTMEGPDITPAHAWRKANLVTERDETGHFDRYECERCDAKARRYGLGGPMVSPRRGSKVPVCKAEEPPTDAEVRDVFVQFMPTDADKTPWYDTANDGNPTRTGLYAVLVRDSQWPYVARVLQHFDADTACWDGPVPSTWRGMLAPITTERQRTPRVQLLEGAQVDNNAAQVELPLRVARVQLKEGV